MSHGKVREQDEAVNVEEKKVGAAVAAEDEEGEEGEGVDGVVLAACGAGKGTVGQKDVEIGTEGHELKEGIVDVVDENHTAAAAAYQLLVAAVEQMPSQQLLHNHEIAYPSISTIQQQEKDLMSKNSVKRLRLA